MSKVKIQDLKNVVLEGGGAKGAVYAGAIQGIEDELQKYYALNPGECLPNAHAILDYGGMVGDKYVPQIKCFAGSSAGAITSFALALGLSSEQVKEVSTYPFKNFLQSTDPGKYRMISSLGKISIGEDRRQLLGRGDGVSSYEFKLDKTQNIKASILKLQIRNQLIKAFTNTLVSGLYDTLEGYLQLFQKIYAGMRSKDQSFLDSMPINVNHDSFYGWGIGAVGSYLRPPQTAPVNNPSPSAMNSTPGAGAIKAAWIKAWWSKGLKWFISHTFRSMSKETGLNLNAEAIGNLFWDRGMFSGFAVREFFFDLILFASVNETHFHRTFFTEPERAKLKAIKFSMAKGRLGASFQGLSAELKDKLEKLGTITFREFFDTTGIRLIICASNFSTDLPIYFSDEWSPDFPLLEAVGASMSIPPAIKPVFNEANVITMPERSGERYKLDTKTLALPKGANNEYFDFAKYNIDLVAIKKHLATRAAKKGVFIDLNNSLNSSGFLPLLAGRIAELRDDQDCSETIDVDGRTVNITYDLLLFHYNATFKGLLFDGGYRCNIPYNVFRASFYWTKHSAQTGDRLFESTLALKLDNTYPLEWISTIYQKLSPATGKLTSLKFLKQEERTLLGKLLRFNFRAIFQNFNQKTREKLLDVEDLRGLDDECFKRIASDVVELYSNQTAPNRSPWNHDKSIIMTAMEGYAYGTETGQIRFLSDHNHIIPLYSFGVGTYDFDLDKIKGLVSLSQAKAVLQVRKYFEPVTPKNRE